MNAETFQIVIGVCERSYLCLASIAGPRIELSDVQSFSEQSVDLVPSRAWSYGAIFLNAGAYLPVADQFFAGHATLRKQLGRTNRTFTDVSTSSTANTLSVI